MYKIIDRINIANLSKMLKSYSIFELYLVILNKILLLVTMWGNWKCF